MRVDSILVALALSIRLPTAIADRGNGENHTPIATCNVAPDRYPTEDPDDRAIPSGAAVAPASTFIPAYSSNRTYNRTLHKRTGSVEFADSCLGSIPDGSKYKGVFNNMRAVLEIAHTQAGELAAAAMNVPSGNVAFRHYFTENQGQVDHFNAMMELIAQDNSPYSIKFECADVPDCKAQQSAMVTDATSGDGPKTIQVCPVFWTASSTKYLLPNEGLVSPSPPYRDPMGNGWCNKQAGEENKSLQTVQFFATAPHTILHELTHLDQLASAAGLDADDDGLHGTIDPQDSCELQGARDYLAKYNANNGLPSPDYNAESYAAAATELYFMDLCGFSVVR